MTIREKLTTYLTDRGMFDDQALSIIAFYEDSELGKPMTGRIDHDEAGYPKYLLDSVIVNLRYSALSWIDDNCHEHWARGLFIETAA